MGTSNARTAPARSAKSLVRCFPTEHGNGQATDELPDQLLSLIEQSIRGVAGGIPADLSDDDVGKLSEMTEHCIRLLDTHDSRVFRGKIVSIEAAESQRAEDAPRTCWADLTQGGVETRSSVRTPR